MLLSVKWLQDFTPYAGSVQDLVHCLTMLGLEVEEQITPFAQLKELRVGRILECRAHPNADQLQLCRVDLGLDRELDIVCGAPNVCSGQMVPVAPAGSKLPSGHSIKKSKIRGVQSQGMILSEKELGLGEDHSGIMVLQPDLNPGQALTQALNLDDLILDIGLTPNRGDCLSVLGIAREVSAAFGLPLFLPDCTLQEEAPASSSLLEIQIQDPELCSLYQARIIRDIRIAPSPFWLRSRLLCLGLRPVNNVVDITNYVLLEMGQPLHAFDRQLLTGELIRVAKAGQNLEFTTLDGQKQDLCPEDLLIWDRDQPVALAGIMGGANSEISPASQEVLLECAVFDPAAVRKTCRRLGLSSESAYRFERGVDQPGSALALDRACSLMQQIAGGSVLQEVSKQEPKPWQSPQIDFRPARAAKLLALDLDQDFCLHTLQNLGCEAKSIDQESCLVCPPSYRLDLTREVDLIEEIARFYGYEAIASKPPVIRRGLLSSRAEPLPDMAGYEFLQRIKLWAQGQGLQEVINYSFAGQKELSRLDLQTDILGIQNPLNLDQDSMRPVLAPGLFQSLALNIAQGNTHLQLFEVARCFQPDSDSETGAREKNLLGLAFHGLRQPEQWPWPRAEADYLELKGLLEHLLCRLLLPDCDCRLQMDHPYLDPALQILLQDTCLGSMGCLKPDIARDYRFRYPVWIAELDLDQLCSMHSGTLPTYRSWPKFPPVTRDMTIIAGPEVSFAALQKKILEFESPILYEYSLQDVYQPKGSPKQNITLRLVYRHSDKTLTDKEVDQEHSRLGSRLLQELPVSFP